MEFYSHGKVLISAEYTVLQGVKALALPTQMGQLMTIHFTNTGNIHWQSYTDKNLCWIEGIFNFNGQCISSKNTPSKVLNRLEKILKVLNELAPGYHQMGVEIKTKLSFPQNWGLGSSSTLINNLAQWLKINPYLLLEKTFGGSGYDVAVAQEGSPLFYTRNGQAPKIDLVHFSPSFCSELFFIYLNQKKDSQEAVAKFQKKQHSNKVINRRIEAIGDQLLQCDTQSTFNHLLKEHERLTGELLDEIPIQERLFQDFDGQIKSLGAWGGDFILASGDKHTPNYFQLKGFETILPYRTFILV